MSFASEDSTGVPERSRPDWRHELRAESVPLRNLPSLTALQAFERAATQASFRRAAMDLALSPSAVSHQIRNLEEHYGVRLFTRDGRCIRLTEEGEGFLEAVTPALGALEAASRDLMRQGRGGRRELRVSTLPFFMSTVMIPALSDFEARWPDLALRMEGATDYADFNRSDVDLAIRFGREQTSGLRFEPLLEVRGMPVCAPQLLHGGAMAPADLESQVLIHVTHQRRGWASWLRAAGVPHLEPRGEMWFDSLTAALDAAEHGLGVALAPHPLINGHKGFGRTLVPAGRPDGGAKTFYLVCRPPQSEARWVMAFRRWIGEALRRASEPASALRGLV